MPRKPDETAMFVLRNNYPADVFTPLSEDEERVAVDALHSCGVSFASDRLHAGWARHLADVYEHYVAEEA